MPTHVLWQADVADFNAWLTVFRQDIANRKAAGIVDLNVWSDPDREKPRHRAVCHRRQGQGPRLF